VATHRSDYRGTQPKLAELAVLHDCVLELQRFTDYAGIFGKIAPPAAMVAQMFDVASKWSTDRRSASDWFNYVATEEGIAWKATRRILNRMKASFGLAAEVDPSLLTTYPSLARLFVIAKESARKANVTKKKGGKKKVAEEAAKAAAQAQASPAAPAPAGHANGAVNGALLN
jgi:hypothetical protein